MPAAFEAVTIEGLDEMERVLQPEVFWAAIVRLIPRALVPILVDMKARAPRGRTGKLGRGFDVQLEPVAQGLVQGVEATIGARVPYGHLIERGHRVIARGPSRKGRKLVRGARRALKLRRQAGGIGFVAPRPFALPAVVAQETSTVALIEQLLAQEIERA